MRKSDKLEMIIKLCSVSIILCACGRDTLVQEVDIEQWSSVQTASDACDSSVQNDEIPELVIESGYSKEGILIDGGCQALLTFQDHELDVWKPVRSRFTYIERGNLICHVFNSREDASSNFDNVYTIENGKWVYAGGGY